MNEKVPYLDQPCERCGSKKILTKVHKVKLQNISSTSEIEYSLIICTNTPCQKEFEINLAERALKAEAIRLKREEAKALRLKH